MRSPTVPAAIALVSLNIAARLASVEAFAPLDTSMAWRSHGRDNADMIGQLTKHNVIKDPRVADAM
jgi:hypothetical protein